MYGCPQECLCLFVCMKNEPPCICLLHKSLQCIGSTKEEKSLFKTVKRPQGRKKSLDKIVNYLPLQTGNGGLRLSEGQKKIKRALAACGGAPACRKS